MLNTTPVAKTYIVRILLFVFAVKRVEIGRLCEKKCVYKKELTK